MVNLYRKTRHFRYDEVKPKIAGRSEKPNFTSSYSCSSSTPQAKQVLSEQQV